MKHFLWRKAEREERLHTRWIVIVLRVRNLTTRLNLTRYDGELCQSFLSLQLLLLISPTSSVDANLYIYRSAASKALLLIEYSWRDTRPYIKPHSWNCALLFGLVNSIKLYSSRLSLRAGRKIRSRWIAIVLSCQTCHPTSARSDLCLLQLITHLLH